MLRTIIDRIAKSYDYVVIDNEAGLEHLSRRTTRDVDVLLIVSDPTVRGLTTAGRVVELIQELKTRVGRHYLLINRTDGVLSSELTQVIQKHSLRLLGTIPADPTVAEFDAVGRPLVELPAESPVVRAVAAIGEKVIG
jgi:CO dehydrogenase maturation factor